MSGVTEVRLYRNTVDEVPAEYTNVTAAVLNSSLNDHATGIKRYLDGVATIDGLAGGTTYYFWVELVDARGNTAGPQPIGSHTTDDGPPSNVVPVMSSATSNGCVVSRSSMFSSLFDAWTLFNRVNGTGNGGWATGDSMPPPHWMAIKLPQAKRVASFRLWNIATWGTFKITSFKIQGSTDGVSNNWADLGEYNDVTYATFPASDKATNEEFQEDFSRDDKETESMFLYENNLTSPGLYMHYRLYISAQDNPRFASATELVLLG